MLKSLIVLAVLVLASVDHSTQLKQVQKDGTRLIEAAPHNYALTGVKLDQLGWKCLTVNRQTVTLWKSDGCQSSTKMISELSSEEAGLIRIKDQFSRNGPFFRGLHNSFFISNNHINSNHFDYDSSQSMDNGRNGVEEFLYSSPSLGQNITVIAVHKDVVSFVGQNSQLQTKPIACLNENEKHLLDEARKGLEENKRKLDAEMRRMKEQLHHDMAEMHRQMARDQERFQRDMNRMQEDLNSAFGPNFPFN